MNLCPKARSENIVVQEIDDEVLVYDLGKNKAACLNKTAAVVWKLCDGEKTISAIAESASKALKRSVDDELVWLALDELKRENLLSKGDAVMPQFKGMGRREILRKVGAASMVALPIVAAISAPKAVMAQSCLAMNAPIDISPQPGAIECFAELTTFAAANCCSGARLRGFYNPASMDCTSSCT